MANGIFVVTAPWYTWDASAFWWHCIGEKSSENYFKRTIYENLSREIFYDQFSLSYTNYHFMNLALNNHPTVKLK